MSYAITNDLSEIHESWTIKVRHRANFLANLSWAQKVKCQNLKKIVQVTFKGFIVKPMIVFT